MVTKTKSPISFRIRRSPRTNQFRCVVVAGNGEIILTGEPCKNRKDVQAMIENFTNAVVDWRWTVIDDTLLQKTNEAITELMADKPSKKPKGYSGKLNRNWP